MASLTPQPVRTRPAKKTAAKKTAKKAPAKKAAASSRTLSAQLTAEKREHQETIGILTDLKKRVAEIIEEVRDELGCTEDAVKELCKDFDIPFPGAYRVTLTFSVEGDVDLVRDNTWQEGVEQMIDTVSVNSMSDNLILVQGDTVKAKWEAIT